MKAHVEKSNKRWRVVIDYGTNPADDKRRRKYYYADNKDKAIDLMDDLKNMLKHGVAPTNMTFGGWIDFWLDKYVCKLAPKTQESYKGEMKRHIKPFLENIPLQELSPLHIDEYYDHASEKGLSATTVNYHHRLLHRICKMAVKKRMLLQNPVDAADPPERTDKAIEFIHWSDITNFLDFVKKKDPGIYPIVMVAILTGMRQGELLGLTWSNVDMEKKKINVCQQLQFIDEQGYMIISPKSKAGTRTISISDALVDVFKGIIKVQAANKLKLPKDNYCKLDLVFCRNDGYYLNRHVVYRSFKNVVTEYGQPKLRFHDLRHSFCSMAVASDIPMEKLQVIMGHENLETTNRIYKHLLEEDLAPEMHKVHKLLGL